MQFAVVSYNSDSSGIFNDTAMQQAVGQMKSVADVLK